MARHLLGNKSEDVMANLYRVALLLLALSVFAGCGQGRRPVQIKRARNGDAAGAVSKLSKDVLADSANKYCLQITSLGKLADENTVFYIYTSDLDLGSLEPTRGPGKSECPRWNSKVEETSRAKFALDLLSSKKSIVQVVRGSDLFQSKVVGPLLNAFNPSGTRGATRPTPEDGTANAPRGRPTVGQKTCPDVAFEAGLYHPACNGGPQSVMLRDDTGNYFRSYHLGKSELIVTVFSRRARIPTCQGLADVNGIYDKQTIVIAWEDGAEHVHLRQPFAALLAKALQNKPRELTDGLANPAGPGTRTDADKTSDRSGKRPKRVARPDGVYITTPVYEFILDEIDAKRIDDGCGGK